MEEAKEKKIICEEKLDILDASVNVENEEEDKGISYELLIGSR